MTTITPAGESGVFNDLADVFEFAGWDPIVSGDPSASFGIEVAGDTRLIFNGAGLGTYVDNFSTTGTISSIEIYEWDGADWALTATWSGFSINADVLAGAVSNPNHAAGDTAFRNALFAGDDTLNGTSAEDSLYGYGGADTIWSGLGPDFVDGGAGNDTLQLSGPPGFPFDTAFDGAVLRGGTGMDTIEMSDVVGNVVDLTDATLLSWEALVFNTAVNAPSYVMLAFDQVGAGIASNATIMGGVNSDHIQFLVADDGSYNLGTLLSGWTFVGWGAQDFVNIRVTSTNPADDFELIGDARNNILSGGNGDDTLTGGNGDDSLSGGTGDDFCNGGIGADRLEGYLGANTLLGGSGNDTIYSFAGALDTIDGGTGLDILQAGGSLAFVGTGTLVQDMRGYTIFDIETLCFNARVGMDKLTVQISGAQARDVFGPTFTVTRLADITLGSYALSIAPIVGDLDISGWTFSLWTVGNRYVELIGDAGANTIRSANVDTTLEGGNGDDALFAGSGLDTLRGGAGNDLLSGGAGVDVLNGAGGVDTASYAGSSAVNVNLATGAASGGHAAGDTLTGIENITGSSANDTLTGNAGANVLDGGAGRDTMAGGGGNDTYIVGVATDVTTEAAAGGVDLVLSTVTRTLGANLENLTLIGSAAINGVGNTAANIITGNGAANALDGGAGADTLNGAAGKDTLTGGAGVDRFVFNVAATPANADTVTDFAAGADKIQLENAVFAALGAAGALGAAKFWIGANAHDADDRVIYNAANGQLFYDANGNAAGQKFLLATLDAGLALTAADFQVI